MSALPALWRGREHFVLLDTAFGHGQRFLDVWRAWRDDPQRCEHLHVIAMLPQVLARTDLQPAPAFEALRSAWPAATPGLHRLRLSEGRVHLLLAMGERAARLAEIVAEVDAFVVDDAAAAQRLVSAPLRLGKALARLAAPGATLWARQLDTLQRAALSAAGFQFEPGNSDAELRAVYAPQFTPRKPAAGRATSRAALPAERHALIVGGGLAGCATAAALAELGWRSSLFDRHAEPAGEASGNPAGLFHGTVHAQDGHHARFNRAAAQAAHAQVQRALRDAGVAGELRGLLRLEAAHEVPAMQRTLTQLGLPEDHVRALDRFEASELAGRPLPTPAWFYAEGGWVDPAGLCRAYLRWAGARCTWRGGHTVQRLERQGGQWQLFNAAGNVLGEAPVLVLAHAGAALDLLGRPDWPVEPLRGQLSLVSAATVSAAGLVLPRLPLVGHGYLLPAVQGLAVFGATSQREDSDPAVRAQDHEQNLAQLALLTGSETGLESSDWQGRTAWRWAAADRLPLIGPVPDVAACQGASVPDRTRLVPRQPGLHVCMALGARGIAWSVLAAQLVAAGIASTPMPVEASLLDAVDPARFASRAVRRAAAAR